MPVFIKNFVSLQGKMDIQMTKPKQSQIKKAAQKFVAEWKNRGKEDKDYVEFWEDLLEDVLAFQEHERRLNLNQK